MQTRGIVTALLLGYLALSAMASPAAAQSSEWKAPFAPTKAEWLELQLQLNFSSPGCLGDLCLMSTEWMAGEVRMHINMHEPTKRQRFEWFVQGIIGEVRRTSTRVGLAPPPLDLWVLIFSKDGSRSTQERYQCAVRPWRTDPPDPKYNEPAFRRDCHAVTVP
jgi:hypothetical protein